MAVTREREVVKNEIPAGQPLQQAEATAWVPPVGLRGGPEMETLKGFHFSCEWTGKVSAGGMGPGSPEMEAAGRAVFVPIMDGAWLVGDFEQEQFLDGKAIIVWKAHYVAGWDPRAGEYRITYADNNGSATLMHGWIEGDGRRFIAEPLGDAPVTIRLTWELPGDGTAKWANECSANGSPWFLVEEYICTPLSSE